MTTPTPPKIQTNPLDPVPNASDLLIQQPGQVVEGQITRSIITQIWMQWLTALREKINVIGNYLAVWAGVNPISGVTPGVYGDATHWPVITFNQYGQATLATQQVASGGAAILINTWAGRPGSPVNPTFLQITDSASHAIWDGSTWNHFYDDAPVTPPIIGNFTLINGGTSTTAAFGPFTTLIPQTGAAYAQRIWEITEPATPYTIEVGFLLPQQSYSSAADGNLFGCGWKEAGTGKLALIWVDNTTANGSLYRIAKFNSPTSINSVYLSYTMFNPPTRAYFMRFSNDGVNRTTYIQNGDESWVQVNQVAFNDFLTPAKVCVTVNVQTGVLQDRLHWIHWKQY